MGDTRLPELVPQQPQDNCTGIERASNRLFDQFLQGDFNVGRNARPLLADACQLNTLTLTDGEDEDKRTLGVQSNLYSLATRMDYAGSGLQAAFQFRPQAGWNNPFRNPTYDLTAQTTDRNTFLNVNSTDGAAPNIRFEHKGQNFNLSYLRNPSTNVLEFNGERNGDAPLSFNFRHDFRRSQTSYDLSAQSADRSTMLNLSSRNNAAPSIEFGYQRSGLGLSYQRDSTTNSLTVHAERTTTSPLSFDFGHNFRSHQTTLGLRAQPRPYCEIGINATTGPRNYYDVGVFVQMDLR